MLAIAFIGVIALVAGVRGWQSYQNGARTDSTRPGLQQLLVALQSYHDEHHSFPPAYVEGPDGRRWHSWRALVLPYVDPEMAAQYSFDEPWDGPNNSKLYDRAPAAYQSAAVDPPAGATSFFAVIDRKTMWPAYQPMSMRDMYDGTSNTIMLVEDSRTDINWLEPKDLLAGELFQSYYDGAAWHDEEGRLIGFADGTVRFLTPKMHRIVLAGLLTAAGPSETFRGDDWPADLEDPLLRQKFYDPRAVETLTETDVVAVTNEPLAPDRNQVWSAAFQLAWDLLKDHLGGDVPLENPTPLTDRLTSSPFDAGSLSEDAVFAGISNGYPDGDEQLLRDLQEKFPDVTPVIHELGGPPPRARMYTMIRKQMPFESRFDRFDEPLTFPRGGEGTEVNSFGYDPGDQQIDHPVFAGQVQILDDRGDEDFIIRLNTVGPQQDQIILALVAPGETLEATWESVRERIEKPNPEHHRYSLEENETLQVPILDLGLQKHFHEIEGLAFEPLVAYAGIELAFVDIRLRLDETGADFVSTGEIGVVGSFGDEEPVYDPERIRRFVLDRPFFIALQEPEAEQPYCLGWIGNAELMEAFGEE